MHYAAGNDSGNDCVDIQKYLVEKGCEVDAQTADGWTPLFTACLVGHLASVQYLVSQGADPEKEETFGEEHNPRSLAQKKNHAAIVAFFDENDKRARPPPGSDASGGGAAPDPRGASSAAMRRAKADRPAPPTRSLAEQAVRTAMMSMSEDNKKKATADGTWGTLSWEERLRRLEDLGLITAAQKL